MTHLELIATDKAYGYVFTNPDIESAMQGYRTARREYNKAMVAFNGSRDSDRALRRAGNNLQAATCAANAAIRDFNPA